MPRKSILQRNAVLEDCYLMIAVLLVVSLTTTCYIYDVVGKTAARFLHIFAFGNHTRIEIYPSRFVVVQRRVGTDFHGRYVGPERCAAACGK